MSVLPVHGADSLDGSGGGPWELESADLAPADMEADVEADVEVEVTGPPGASRSES